MICLHCQTEMKIVSFIVERKVIRKILTHLKVWPGNNEIRGSSLWSGKVGQLNGTAKANAISNASDGCLFCDLCGNVDGLWLLPSTLPEVVVQEGHKNHLAVLVLAHFGAPI